MFKTFQGVTEDAKNTVYLRPETAQGIFVNFKNVQRTSRKKFHLVSDRLVNHSVTRLHQVTLHSVPESSNRWNLNSSASRIQILSGLITGRSSVSNWLSALGLKDDEVRDRDHDKEELSSTVKQRQTLSSYSHSDGVNCGESLTVQITT